MADTASDARTARTEQIVLTIGFIITYGATIFWSLFLSALAIRDGNAIGVYVTDSALMDADVKPFQGEYDNERLALRSIDAKLLGKSIASEPAGTYVSLTKLAVFAALTFTPAPPAHAAPGDVEFVLERKIPSEVGRINYVSLESGGETILCGGGGGAWVSVLGESGQPKFRGVVDVQKDGAHEACWTVLAHGPERILIAGETNTHSLVGREWVQDSLPAVRRYEAVPQAALLASMHADGSTASKRALGNLKKYYRNAFYRGLRVADGYVLLGTLSNEWPAFTPSRTQGIPGLWVVKLDFAGQQIWEYKLAEDANDVLEAGRSDDFFSKLLELPDGSIVFAASMGRLAHSQQAGERWLLGRLEVNAQNPGGMLMVKLSPDGKELRRIWSGADVHIALRGGDIIAVGNPPRRDRIATVLDRLETVVFDYDLNRKSSNILEIAPQLFQVEGIATAARGGLFAIGAYASGRPGERYREEALVEITAKGMHVLKRFRPGQWGGIARSPDTDDFVAVLLSTPPFTSRDMSRELEITKFRIAR